MFFALGLMSKPMVVTLPFLMLLLDFWPLKRFRPADVAAQDAGPAGQAVTTATGLTLRDLFLEKRAFFAMTVLSCVVTFVVQKSGHAVVPIAKMPLLPRFENSVTGCISYAQKMFWPSRLAVLYPLQPEIPLAKIITALALLAIVTVAALKLLRAAPYVAFGWFWFLGMLVPVIGIVQVGGQSMAEAKKVS